MKLVVQKIFQSSYQLVTQCSIHLNTAILRLELLSKPIHKGRKFDVNWSKSKFHKRIYELNSKKLSSILSFRPVEYRLYAFGGGKDFDTFHGTPKELHYT